MSSARRAGIALCCAALAGCGGCGGDQQQAEPAFVVGAVEDAPKSGDGNRATELARKAGMRAIVLSAVWTPPLEQPPEAELDALRGAVEAAARRDIRPIVAVYQFSGATPLSDAARAQFAAYAASIPRELPDVRDVIVGNEPNLNLFWLPQFGPSGEDVAAPAYLALLERAYDAIKAVSADVRVIGGGLAPRGSDRPGGGRQTHSPTAFLRDLGAAFRASGRERPPLDAFSMHVYGESSRIPPDFPHPRSTSIGLADHAELARLLHQAFGRTVPIVYGEYGVETAIPARKAALYSGSEPVSTGVVDEATQARYYTDAIRMAACQPDVEMLLLFHVFDEPRLDRLQSGLYYADATPKSSLEPVAEAARKASTGELECRP